MKQSKSKIPTATPSKAAVKKAPATPRTETRAQPPSPPAKSKKAAVPTPARTRAKATKPGKGSKTDKTLALLQRPGGAPLSALMKATGWQGHSLRAFMSATLGKRRGLTVVSVADENGGERRYSIKA